MTRASGPSKREELLLAGLAVAAVAATIAVVASGGESGTQQVPVTPLLNAASRRWRSRAARKRRTSRARSWSRSPKGSSQDRADNRSSSQSQRRWLISAPELLRVVGANASIALPCGALRARHRCMGGGLRPIEKAELRRKGETSARTAVGQQDPHRYIGHPAVADFFVVGEVLGSDCRVQDRTETSGAPGAVSMSGTPMSNVPPNGLAAGSRAPPNTCCVLTGSIAST